MMSQNIMDILNKGVGSRSVTPAPFQDPGASLKSKGSADQNAKLAQIANLSRVSGDVLRKLLDKKESLEQDIRRVTAENAVPLGIYPYEGQMVFVCPSGLFKEDNMVAAMIADLAKTVGADLRVVEMPADTTTMYSEDFIRGLWFGMFSSTNQRRSRKKQAYEMGRACSFALIAKSEISSIPWLGPAALARDNHFFGNNPNEVDDRNTRIPFYAKTRLGVSFQNPEIGNLIFGILNYVSSKIGFNNLTYEEQDKVVMSHILPLDELITSLYPRVVVKAKNRENVKVKKPNPIRQSPLYTKEEMELISSMTSYVFTELEELQSNYLESLYSLGFDGLKADIRRKINTRWETLQRFASRTKLRLQKIRHLTKEVTLKKAKVTPAHLDRLLADFQSPMANLVLDIKHIVGASDYIRCAQYAFKRDFATDKSVTEYLMNRAYSIYSEMEEGKIKVQLKPITGYQEPSELDYNRAVTALLKLKNYAGSLAHHMQGIGNVKEFKLIGRTRQVLIHLDHIRLLDSELANMNGDLLRVGSGLISNGKYTSYEEMRRSLLRNPESARLQAVPLLKSSVNKIESDDIKSVALDLYDRLQTSLYERG